MFGFAESETGMAGLSGMEGMSKENREGVKEVAA